VPLGVVEADVVSLIINYEHDRVLALQGPRGAGKSSLLNYIDAAFRNSSFSYPPVFVRLDGLQLVGDHAQSADTEVFDRDCPRLLAAAVNEVLPNVQDPLRTALRRCGERLGAGTAAADVREAFRDLSKELMDRERRRIVVVFDNLDHLPVDWIRAALGLARAVYTASRVAILICLRPNCLLGASQRGDARAFFRYTVNVPAPSPLAWITLLADRVEAAAMGSQKEYGAPLQILGKEVGPAALRASLLRFGDLLAFRSAKSAQGDAAAIIQAMAADDTRQLRILVRRILGHARLPVRYLLGLEEKAEYFPLEGLLEGPRSCFKGDRFVPNLLYFRHAMNEPDLILSHRILTLLSQDEALDARELLASLELMDYPQSAAIACLHMLHGPKLVRGTDTDSFDPASPPRALQLTSAGNYYRAHLFRSADYLGNAVLDVPLEHRELRRELDRDQAAVRSAAFGNGIPFSIKLDSILEYAEEVANREWNQINALTRARPSQRLRRVVDQLQRGGLMTADLVYALNGVLERSQGSRSAQLRRNLEDYTHRIGALQSRLVNVFDKRLLEVGNRGRKAPRAAEAPVLIINLGNVEITATEVGDDLVPEATVRGENSSGLTIVSITGSAAGAGFSRAALAKPISSGPSELTDQHSVVAKLGRVPNCVGAELTNVEVAASSVEHAGKRLFLLAPEYTANNVELKLFQWLPGAPDVEPLRLGGAVACDTLKAEVHKWLEQVNSECGQGHVSRRTIETVGTQLGRRVMDAAGSNHLATLLGQDADCIIAAGEEDVLVPWEWLRPTPRIGERIPTLSERWHTVRWTKSLAALAVRGGHHPKRTATRLCTIGLDTDAAKPWRHPVPSSPEEFSQLCANFDVLHVVGHFAKDSDKVLIGGRGTGKKLGLDYEDAIAHPFCDNKHAVVLSACGVGRLNRSRNIALAIAEAHGATTWAPLVSITEAQAASLDDRLADSLATVNTTPFAPRVGDLLREAMADSVLSGLGSVYVGFGI
jgi:hypothetical protein